MKVLNTVCWRVGLLSLTITASIVTGAGLAEDNTAPALGFVGEKGGRGAWPAVAQSRADLRTHTLYRPVSLPPEPLPLLIWGNGGCSDNGLVHDKFLRNIASHGYIVIAADFPLTNYFAPGGPYLGDVVNQPGDVSFLINYMLERNLKSGDSLYQHVDPQRIGVFGLSLGGMTAA